MGYLQDTTFLDKLNALPVREQLVRITVLSWDEQPIEEIQGRVINGGTVNIDGTSNVRRTCQLTVFAEEEENDLERVNQLLSINKKVRLELGIKNDVPKEIVEREMKNQVGDDIIVQEERDYKDIYGDYIWFPLGIYLIFNPNLNHTLNGVTISLQLRDKMTLLNGEVAGILPSAVTFHEWDEVLDDGSVVVTKPTIRRIIQELINHWGGEPLENIVIEDLDERIKQTMQYVGNTPLYLLRTGTDGNFSYTITVNKNDAGTGYYRKFETGEDCGFIMTDFTFPSELIGDAGSSITSILDKIIEVLGNFEYFYDVEGKFHFQEIKNFLNTTYVTQYGKNFFNGLDYKNDFSSGKSVYTFEGQGLISAIANNPKFDNIKNDFMVWGIQKNIDGLELPIRYHLSIDRRPTTGNTYYAYYYTDEFGIVRATPIYKYDTKDTFPQIGMIGRIYKDNDNTLYYKWNDTLKTYVNCTSQMVEVITTDYREEWYYQGIEATNEGIDYPYYYTELLNEFPIIYDLIQQEFKEEYYNRPNNLQFFLDVLDVSSQLGEYSVESIGRRTKVISSNDINCLFESDIPDFVYILNTSETREQEIAECIAKGQAYIQVDEDIYNLMILGGSSNSAYVEIGNLLYQYTNMSNTISITAIPIYYLDVNTRITVRDDGTGVNGDFMISNMNIPLDHTAQMTINAYKALQKI